MDELQRFAELAARAREESPPPIDVRDRVLATIAAPRPRSGIDQPLAVCSVVSALAASIAAVMAVEMWSALTDPMTGLFDTLTLVMQ
ncbi:MAG: hypothetical protein ACOY3P_08790 [Planctomycetota bacterium]